MSGPKVVRIVTREEIGAICRRHIAALDAATREVRGVAARCGALDATMEAALDGRIRQFEDMFTAARWMDIQKRVPDAVAFLHAEGERIRAQAVSAASAARTRGRRLGEAARAIVAALQAAGTDVPPGLRTLATNRVPAGGLDVGERELSEALALLPSARRDVAAEAATKELAERLGSGERTLTVAQWMLGRTAEPNAAQRRLDGLLAELEMVSGAEAQVFSDRAAAVALEQEPSRQALLTDSLVLDVAAHVGQLRRQQTAMAALNAAAASLAGSVSMAADALRAEIASALERRSIEAAPALTAAVAALVDAEAKGAAATARRRAILSGLSSLGYEVRETMETTWARDGRIVVRKPGSTEYGVELGAPADASRLQVRLVGSNRPSMLRDARRDADQEAMWCTEFDRLRTGLAEGGDELVIERALEPGAQALRTVVVPDAIEAEPAKPVRAPRERGLT